MLNHHARVWIICHGAMLVCRPSSLLLTFDPGVEVNVDISTTHAIVNGAQALRTSVYYFVYGIAHLGIVTDEGVIAAYGLSSSCNLVLMITTFSN